jgi:hypothetical protein
MPQERPEVKTLRQDVQKALAINFPPVEHGPDSVDSQSQFDDASRVNSRATLSRDFESLQGLSEPERQQILSALKLSPTDAERINYLLGECKIFPSGFATPDDLVSPVSPEGILRDVESGRTDLANDKVEIVLNACGFEKSPDEFAVPRMDRLFGAMKRLTDDQRSLLDFFGVDIPVPNPELIKSQVDPGSDVPPERRQTKIVSWKF